VAPAKNFHQTGSGAVSDPPAPGWLTPTREALWLGLILLAFFTLGWMSLIQKSVTVDEFAHLPAGLSYWRTRDFRIYPHGSPLIQMLAAAPIAASRVPLPLELGWKNRDQWQFGYEFMYANADSYQEIFVRARAMILALGALLVGLIWWWARALDGPKSALAAASLAAFNPTLMAHSELVTTDVGVSLTMLAAVVALWAFCRRPSAARMAGAGVRFWFKSVTVQPGQFMTNAHVRLPGHMVITCRQLAGPPGQTPTLP